MKITIILVTIFISFNCFANIEFDYMFSIPNLYPDGFCNSKLFDIDGDEEKEIVILYNQDIFNGRIISYNFDGEEIFNWVFPKLTLLEYLDFQFIHNEVNSYLLLISKEYHSSNHCYYLKFGLYDISDFSLISLGGCPTNNSSNETVQLEFQVTDFEDDFFLWISASGYRLYKYIITESGFELLESFYNTIDNIFYEKSLNKIITSEYYIFWSDSGWGPGGYVFGEDSLRYCLKSYSLDLESTVDSLDSEEGFFHGDSYGDIHYEHYPNELKCLIENDKMNNSQKVIYYNILDNWNNGNFGTYKGFTADFSQQIWEEVIDNVPSDPNEDAILISTCLSTNQNDYVLVFRYDNSLQLINKETGETITNYNCDIQPVSILQLDTEELLFFEHSYDVFNIYTIDEASVSSEFENILENVDYTSLHNYPNPFNPETTISFNLDEVEKVELEIFNIRGQKVKQLVSIQLPAGKHSIIWDGKDSYDKQVSSGIYMYKLKVGDFQQTKKMILLK